jgi:hypothetical protein
MSRSTYVGLTLDTGALLALDTASKTDWMHAILEDTVDRGGSLCVPANVVAQAWRSKRQVRLARLLKSPGVEISVLDIPTARVVGAMCAQSGHNDVIDVHVALCARERRHAVVTSDPDDIAKVDPSLALLRV